MTDTELDEILDKWGTPPAPRTLRDRVRMGFAGLRPQRTWRFVPATPGKGLIAGAALAGLAILISVTTARSQPGPAVPWTVDSEIIQYTDRGSPSVKMHTTSYELNGSEVLVSRSVPGDPVLTTLDRAFDAATPALLYVHLHVLGLVNPEMVQRFNQARVSRLPGVELIAGCDEFCMGLEHYYYLKPKSGPGCIAAPVVDRAKILNYPTEAVQERWTEHGRMTLWTAPQLGCFALKATFEQQETDGTFRLVKAKQAVKVNLNR